LDLIEPRSSNAGGGDAVVSNVPNTADLYRSTFQGTLITAGGYDPSSAAEVIKREKADGVAFGRWFISNPDLPERIRRNLALTKYDRSTFYGGEAKGYTDYPFAEEPKSH
jgi:N-ethylmaleimide reductase